MNILYELKNIEYFFDEKRVLSIDNLILEENKIIGFFLGQTVVENLHFFLFYLLFLNHKMVK